MKTKKTDGDKLRLLADWFDARYPEDPTPEVQNDLRRMAKKLDELDLKKETTDYGYQRCLWCGEVIKKYDR